MKRREGKGRGGGKYVGGMSDSRRARSSAGSSMSLNASWWWLVENGMSLAYRVDILINGDLDTYFKESEDLECSSCWDVQFFDVPGCKKVRSSTRGILTCVIDQSSASS